MRTRHGVTLVSFCIAIVGTVVVSSGWAEDKRSLGSETDKVNCSMEGTSLKCPFVNSKYTFVANMEQPIDAGSNGTGTMTLESGVSNYTGVNCQIDVNPDFSSINGSIWCGNRHATLSQPAVHVMFANAVHGNGSFFIPQ